MRFFAPVRLLCLAILAVFLLENLSAHAAMQSSHQTLPLNSGWQFRQMDTANAQWRPATVPGDVHLDLIANKVIGDPFFRDNEAKYQWISQAGWEYRTAITADRAMLARRHIDLVFEGLDTYALVYFNDKLLITADNMFRAWQVDLKSHLRPGANQLRVVFPPPDKAAHERASHDKWQPIIKAPEKTYIRRAAYEYGWDWAPTFVTSGIWRPASLSLWENARIDDLHIAQTDISPRVARVNAQLAITSAVDSSGTLVLSYTQDGKKVTTTRAVTLHHGDNTIDVPVEIARPALWYPAGYGAQPLYEFTAELRIGTRLEDQKTTRTGLRSVELQRKRDQWGRSFSLIVNGIPIFAKGADVIPFDSFPSRVTTAQYRSILQSAVDANMNMIRLWGGGYYETDEFYAICDELGLMVWQDFMFGNEWQPGTYDFKQNVEQEAEYQVTRLRNHPSIVLWCGNNETEISWDWGSVSSIANSVTPEQRRRMWEDYLTVFSGILARTVARLAPDIPYWPSSPSADYEDVSASYASGDMHDWSIFYNRAPFTEFEKHHGRFLTEYGFQSLPQMSTIESFTDPADRTSIFTPVMLAHQKKNNEGNSLIQDYMLKDYPEPKDFASFLYASQVLQAEGIKIGAEHHRRDRPRTMGSLYWQLNDCWPVTSWSSIDYYGNWKALQYYARRFYSPLLISPHVEDDYFTVYVVSDKTMPVHTDLRVRIMTFDGKVISQHAQSMRIDPLSSKIYYAVPLPELLGQLGIASSTVFVATDLAVDDQTVSTNLIYLAPTKQVHLPPAEITHALTPTPGKEGSYTLTLSSRVLARSAYITFGPQKVELSDNYIDLLPNEPTTITIPSSASLDELMKTFKVISLVDAFPR